MRRFYLFSLLLWLLIPLQQARADGVTHCALDETFNVNNGTGGRDERFSDQIATSNIAYDLEGWTGNKQDNYVYGAYHCIKLGSSKNAGSCTTPEIILIGTGKTATLTFNAAGWGSGSNTLTVTANEGVTLSGNTSITLANGTWKPYTVNITVTTADYVQLTFTGQRGFLDDVKVVETVTAINAPTLPDDFEFWPKTTEEIATTHVTIAPSDSTTVYYTTDGTEPSTTNGKVTTLPMSISITGTTTVKARAYYGTVASSVVSKFYEQGTTVNSISDFRCFTEDTELRLFLQDDNNHATRVLYYDEARHQLFLRENSNDCIMVDFGETATFNPIPQYNQHVAGWIVGKYKKEGNMHKLVATANTNTNFLAFAEPVTEGVVFPNDVNLVVLPNHIANLVTINGVRVGTDITVSDRFGTTVYDGALAELSGIVLADGSIAPITQDFFTGVVYIIDENQDFVSPPSDIENAKVRLRRTLSKDYWNTFTVPFDIDITKMDGSIREYDHADGSTMMFKDAASIEAGKPYLVKPSSNIANPEYEGVTLKATAAQTATYGNYSFVATYSPVSLAADQTEAFLKPDGKVYFPGATSGQLKGMRAFFRMPANAPATLLIDGDMTGISQIENGELRIDNVYDLQGRKVAHPTKGLYIVNGKKLIIH